MLNDKHIWVTWERQTRNRSMAKVLQANYLEYTYKKGWFRYAILSLKTIWVLFKKKPEVIYFQNPSVVLGLVCVLYGALCRRVTLVGDYHNCALDDASWLFRVNAFIARRCLFVIVTNSSLEGVVTRMGGAAVSFPDPLPEVEQIGVENARKNTAIVFVTSWASDEPINEVLDAFIGAELRNAGASLLITGRPKFNKLVHLQDYYEQHDIKFMGFVDEASYWSLLKNAAFIIDLTTRDNCMVCGAYEALAVNRVLLLSGNQATRDYFGDGLVYTTNTRDDIQEKLLFMHNNIESLSDRVTGTVASVLKKQCENVMKIKYLVEKNSQAGM